MAKKGVTLAIDVISDGWKASCRRDVFVSDKLVPFDLQQLPLTLHMKSSRALESVERRDQVLDCTRAWCVFVVSKRRWFFQMCWSDDITDDAWPIRLLMSGRQ